MNKLETFAGMAMQGILSNPQLHDGFWKDYEALAKEIGAAKASETIEKRIAYRAIRVAAALALALPES